jgi:hypothetical protein
MIIQLPRGDQPRARPDLRPTSISSGSSNSACFWGTLCPVLVDFCPFLVDFRPIGPFINLQNTILRTFGLFKCLLACIHDPGWAQHRPTLSNAPGRMMPWTLALLVQEPFADHFWALFLTAFWPNLPSIFHQVAASASYSS